MPRIACPAALARWPRVPALQDADVVELETEKQLFYCKDCDYQFSVTAGTIFNDSHLPLNKWFMATLLLCEAKKGMSACQIQRTLGIGSYKTAWYLCHRIRAAMVEVEQAHARRQGRNGRNLCRRQS